MNFDEQRAAVAAADATVGPVGQLVPEREARERLRAARRCGPGSAGLKAAQAWLMATGMVRIVSKEDERGAPARYWQRVLPRPITADDAARMRAEARERELLAAERQRLEQLERYSRAGKAVQS